MVEPGAREARVNYETLLRDLHAVRDRAGQFQVAADGGHSETEVAGALEELDVALEELRVAEEEVRTQQEALAEERLRDQAERERYQALFVLAPAAYVVTDAAGVIRDANLRAVDLFGIDRRFVAGKSLASFVDPEDRSRFRDRLVRLAREDAADWRVRLRAGGQRGGEPVPATVSVAVGRDHAGTVRELRWLLWPATQGTAAPGPTGTAAAALAPVGHPRPTRGPPSTTWRPPCTRSSTRPRCWSGPTGPG
jgi:PAS domain S-box-containing protein